MKKICFILPTLQAGGLENYVLRFLKYAEGQYEVTILCASNEDPHLLNEYVKLGVNIVFKRFGYYNPIVFIQLFKYLFINKFEVICSFSGNFSGLSLLISNIAKIPIRIAFYRRSSNGFKINSIRLLYNYICNRLVYYNATNILSNSKFAFKVFFPLEYKNDSKFKVIKNGVGKSAFTPNKDISLLRYKYGIPLNAFVVGHIGRYDSSKNHITIIRVAQILLRQYSDIVFVFCGKDTDSDEFKKVVGEEDCSNRIICLGLQTNVPEVLQLMDLFYFPSVTEGQPNALIEAMLTGLPVITSNIEPIKETIPEYAHLHLLDPFNINNAVDLIALLKIDINLREKYIYKHWAAHEYDLNTNFRLFRDVIDGT